ncbi:hypothetical protein MVG78_19800 (plasmid) [Roseomonas gilardii subsp. gilardii]|uniref:ArnT family glycosyltransferase n=1 Tax=Roseomonas gilardii TaxID=257708 RepID=UPI001FF7F6A3|nr:hypothetical protein [Roseomonas gilardii]UPG74698.1 hypothetical protein MVG78_19800 [Roseomonas gilardii subsp. gilardii]
MPDPARQPVPDPPALQPLSTAAGQEDVAREMPLTLCAAILLLFAFVIRAPVFGNPALGVDETFYLLVGDRLLHGALPFVDLWDRKPVGLFLIYAAIRLLGGEGVYQYQVVATLFAAATAGMIAAVAASFATRAGALCSGLVYLAFLGAFEGVGGQSPVFYNLFVVLAAWLTLRAGRRSPAARLTLGCTAMLLAGVAIQTKYTAVFEGMFLGCVLLWQGWRAGIRPTVLMLHGAAWIACGLLPTVAALAFYLLRGQGEAFLHANFLSVFERSTFGEGSSLLRLGSILLLLAPLLLAAALSRYPRRLIRPGSGRDAVAAQDFVTAWSLAALAGFLAFGTYYSHYALPLLVPLSAMAAPAFGTCWRTGLKLGRAAWTPRLPAALPVILFGLVASFVLVTKHIRQRGDGTEIQRIVPFIQPRLKGCLYVFDGEPVLYHLTGSCIPTRYAFPSHLSDRKEAGAIGVDQVTEIHRIFATHPGMVVTWEGMQPRSNAESLAAVEDELARHYRKVLEVPVGRHRRQIYQRLPDGEADTPGAMR